MHTITITDEHLAVITAALQELPFRVAMPVLQEIGKQIAATNTGGVGK